MMESKISNNNTKNQKHSATQNHDTYSAAGICPPGNQRNKVKQETAQKELTNDTHTLLDDDNDEDNLCAGGHCVDA